MKNPAFEHFPPVLSTEAMRAADRAAIEERRLPGRLLMEIAARGVADHIKEFLGELEDRRALVACGNGNNGGDGLAVARILHDRGALVRVVFVGDDEKQSPDSTANRILLEDLARESDRLTIERGTDAGRIDWYWPEVIIDGLLGIGVEGTLREPSRSLCAAMNTSPAPVVAIDIPTGLNSDTGIASEDCVVADLTVTMAAVKAGMLFCDGPAHCGRVVPVEIGIPRTDLRQAAQSVGSGFLSSDRGVSELLPPRPLNSHKYSAGRVLVIAGSRSFPGAAVMTAGAASRSGAGAVMVATPEGARPIVATQLDSEMSLGLAETAEGTLSLEALPELLERAEIADAVIVGPGLDRHDETFALVRKLLARIDKPVVVDADGLNALAGHLDILRGEVGRNCIITPHLGELRRLLQKPDFTLERRLVAARELAERFGVTLLLKGMPSVVSTPEGPCFVADTATPALATAGTGDVLAGVIGGFLAQGLGPANAAIAGLHVSGRAAEHAASDGSRSILATDIVTALPAVMPS